MLSRLVSISLLILLASSSYNPDNCPSCDGADDTSCPEGCSCIDASEIDIELDGWFCGGSCCGDSAELVSDILAQAEEEMDNADNSDTNIQKLQDKGQEAKDRLTAKADGLEDKLDELESKLRENADYIEETLRSFASTVGTGGIEEELRNQYEEKKDELEQQADELEAKLREGADALEEGIRAFISTVGVDEITENLENKADEFKDVVDGYQEELEQAIDELENQVSWVTMTTTSAEAVAADVEDELEDQADDIEQQADELEDDLEDQADELEEAADELEQELRVVEAADVEDQLEDKADDLEHEIEEEADEVEQALRQAADINNELQDKVDNLGDKVGELGDQLRENIDPDQLEETVRDKADELEDKAQELGEGLEEKADELENQLRDVDLPSISGPSSGGRDWENFFSDMVANNCPTCSGYDDTSCGEKCSCVYGPHMDHRLTGWYCMGDCCEEVDSEEIAQYVGDENYAAETVGDKVNELGDQLQENFDPDQLEQTFEEKSDELEQRADELEKELEQKADELENKLRDIDAPSVGGDAVTVGENIDPDQLEETVRDKADELEDKAQELGEGLEEKADELENQLRDVDLPDISGPSSGDKDWENFFSDMVSSKCPTCSGYDDTSCGEGCSCKYGPHMDHRLTGFYCIGDCCESKDSEDIAQYKSSEDENDAAKSAVDPDFTQQVNYENETAETANDAKKFWIFNQNEMTLIISILAFVIICLLVGIICGACITPNKPFFQPTDKNYPVDI